MNGNTNQFRADLRSSLERIAASFERFNALIHEKTASTEQELRERFTELAQEAEQSRSKATAAYGQLIRRWEEEKSEEIEKIIDWKIKRLTGQLHARADRLERCAVTAAEVAVVAMDEAERTILQALLARKEAISIQVQRLDQG